MVFYEGNFSEKDSYKMRFDFFTIFISLTLFSQPFLNFKVPIGRFGITQGTGASFKFKLIHKLTPSHETTLRLAIFSSLVLLGQRETKLRTFKHRQKSLQRSL